MKTAIIDRSLVGVQFKDVTQKSDVYLYVSSLLETGADYVEVDLPALVRLPKPVSSDKYIFRVERQDEYMIANALPFSYALLPLKFSYLIDKINKPVILEIKTGDADLLALLKVVSESINLTGVSLLRLVGDFKKQTDELNLIINKIRMKYAVPIDICPLNNAIGALPAAIAAYQSRIDSLTVSFGDVDNFTSLEEFLITLSTVYKTIVSKSYIAGICKAAVLSSLISNIESQNLKILMRSYRLCPRQIEKVDELPRERNVKLQKKPRRKSILERRLGNMEVEEELLTEIIEKLKFCGADYNNNEKKEYSLN